MPARTTQIPADDPLIIAPCGLNCGVCRAYLRTRNPCPGCRGGPENKSNSCLACEIRNCPERVADQPDFCFTCSQFPCEKLQHLDKRYRTQYGVNVISNLESIDQSTLEHFMQEETRSWLCQKCGTHLCMHQPQCMQCGYTRPETR